MIKSVETLASVKSYSTPDDHCSTVCVDVDSNPSPSIVLNVAVSYKI